MRGTQKVRQGIQYNVEIWKLNLRLRNNAPMPENNQDVGRHVWTRSKYRVCQSARRRLVIESSYARFVQIFALYQAQTRGMLSPFSSHRCTLRSSDMAPDSALIHREAFLLITVFSGLNSMRSCFGISSRPTMASVQFLISPKGFAR